MSVFVPAVQEVFKTYEADFKAAGIWYEHRLIDDMVAYGSLLFNTSASPFAAFGTWRW